MRGRCRSVRTVAVYQYRILSEYEVVFTPRALESFLQIAEFPEQGECTGN